MVLLTSYEGLGVESLSRLLQVPAYKGHRTSKKPWIKFHETYNNLNHFTQIYNDNILWVGIHLKSVIKRASARRG